MSSSIKRLGDIVGAFRRRLGLTQEEVAAHLGPPANRSLLAHLEQGRRLPSVDLLTRICEDLEIPKDVWRPFLSAGFQRTRISTSPKGVKLRPFQQIVICGNNGSGKSTLAEALSRALSIPRVPYSPRGRNYLSDLSANPSRWAFEAQIAFLTEKAIQLRHHLEQGQPVIVERSLSEDVHVYAKYFSESGDMDNRSAETFRIVAEHFLDVLPEPDLAIFCSCPIPEMLERVAIRNREDANLRLHSKERLTSLGHLYDDWAKNQAPANLYQIDTSIVDLRDPLMIEQVFHDLELLLGEDFGRIQLELFPQTRSHPSCSLLTPAHDNRFLSNPKHTATFPVFGSGARIAPRAYIAAPFTAIATPASIADKAAELFPHPPGHGIIPRGGYRTVLLNIERTLAQLGIVSLIPHRDVNQWGLRVLTPAEAMQGCTDHVQNCDLFVGLLGNSCGAHYEFGLAIGLGKPCIIITPHSMPASFLAQGVHRLDAQNLLVVTVPDIEDAGKSLGSDLVRDFVLQTVNGSGGALDLEVQDV